MAHLTDIDNVAPAHSLKGGADVLNTWRTRIDALNDVLGSITTAEANQLENIGSTTISVAQWVCLGALDQSIISTASVDFGEVDITKTTTLAAGGFGLRCQVTHSTTGMTGTLRGAYIVATNAPFTATGTIRGAEIKARAATSGDVGGNVTTLEGVSISCDAKNKTVTTQRGMEVILDGKSGAAITTGVGIRIANNYQANIATTSYAIQIYRDSFDYTADIQLSGGGLIGGSTGKIKMDSSGVTTFTASANLDIGAYEFRAQTIHGDATVKAGVDDTTAGELIIYGAATGVTDGGCIKLHTAADHDTTYNFYQLNIDEDDFILKQGTTTKLTLAGADGNWILVGTLTLDGLVATTGLDIGAYTFRCNGLIDDSLTSGRVIFATTNGQLADDADFTFATDTLTVTKLGAFQATGAIDFNSQNMTNVDIDSGTINGITDLAVADGGTGSSTAGNARTALGLAIGSDVLAYDAGLSNLAGIAMAADKFYYTSADNTHVAGTVTTFGRSIIDDADEATFKGTVNLEIGTDVLAQQTIGIADDNLLEVDHASAADNDYAKFTANGLEGRSYSETVSDLSLDTRRLENLCRNAPFGSRSGGTSAVPDEWTLEGTPTVAYDTVDTTYGDYAVKLTASGAGDEGINQTFTHLKISTKYQIFARVKVDAGDTASLITTGATTNIDTDSTSTTWENITGEFVTDASGTDVVIKLVASADGDVAYFCGITCVEGDIPPGNFIRRVNEIIYLQTAITDTNWNGDAKSDDDSTILDLSAFGNGCPPKIKAILFLLLATDSASTTNAGAWLPSISVGPTSGNAGSVLYLMEVPDGRYRASQGFCSCDSNGDVYITIDATGEDTLEVHFRIWGYVLGE